MTKTFPLLPLAVLALAISGCGGGSAPAEDQHALLDAAQEPLDKAREVEDISAGRKAQLDEEIGDADQ